MQHWTHLQNRGQGTGAYQHAIPAADSQPTSRGPEKSNCKGPEGPGSLKHWDRAGESAAGTPRSLVGYGLESWVQYE